MYVIHIEEMHYEGSGWVDRFKRGYWDGWIEFEQDGIKDCVEGSFPFVFNLAEEMSLGDNAADIIHDAEALGVGTHTF
jgi:hypothetical protein